MFLVEDIVVLIKLLPKSIDDTNCRDDILKFVLRAHIIFFVKNHIK